MIVWNILFPCLPVLTILNNNKTTTTTVFIYQCSWKYNTILHYMYTCRMLSYSEFFFVPTSVHPLRWNFFLGPESQATQPCKVPPWCCESKNNLNESKLSDKFPSAPALLLEPQNPISCTNIMWWDECKCLHPGCILYGRARLTDRVPPALVKHTSVVNAQISDVWTRHCEQI